MKTKRKVLCGVVTWIVFFCYYVTLPYEEQEISGWGHHAVRDIRHYMVAEARHMPVEFCKNDDVLLVVVHSKPSNFQLRSTVRATWGREVKSLFFLLGETANETVQNQIEEESSRRQDIIQESFVDSYNNLTLKSVMMLKLASTKCFNHRYLLKTDDDIMILVDNILKLLVTADRDLLIGQLYCKAAPNRNPKNKWYIPPYLYPEEEFPDYVSGGAYLMSIEVAEKLYLAALKTPIFPVEDVYVTGMCAKEAGIVPRNSDLFVKKTKTLKRELWCSLRELCAIFNMDVREMWKVHVVLKNPWWFQECEVGGFSGAQWMMDNVLGAKNRPFSYRGTCA